MAEPCPLPESPPAELVENLVGLDDIAKRLGVGYTAVHNYAANRRGPAKAFPAPVMTFGARRIWWWPQVLAWAREYSGSTITRTGGTRRNFEGLRSTGGQQ